MRRIEHRYRRQPSGNTQARAVRVMVAPLRHHRGPGSKDLTAEITAHVPRGISRLSKDSTGHPKSSTERAFRNEFWYIQGARH